MKLYIITVICIISICSSAAAVELPASAATIYVENNSGERITSGSGVVISREGVIATDMHVVLAWLESKGNSLFVKASDGGYYPLKSVVRIDRDLGLALFKIDASGLSPASSSIEQATVQGDGIYIIADKGRLNKSTLEGVISGIDEDGSYELSVPVEGRFRGASVLNTNGDIIGIAIHRDLANLALPLEKVLELASREIETDDASLTPNMSSIKRAKRAVQSNRARPEDYLRLGIVYSKSNMLELAVNAFKKAVELNPEYAEAYHGLGISYARQQMYDEAVEAMERAVKLDPQYATAFANLGFIYDYLGRHDDATSSFLRAIELKPEYAEAYNGLGVAYAREKNYTDAIASFKQALSLRPEFKQARFNLGLSYVSLGEQNNAINEEIILREIAPEMADRLRELIESVEKTEGAEEESNDEDNIMEDVPNDEVLNSEEG